MCLKHKDFPLLATDRLHLRKITKEDAADIYRYLSDKAVMKYYGMEPFQSVEETVEEIDWYSKIHMQQTGIRWGITLKGEDKVIGSCGFLNWEKRHFRSEVGFELHQQYWGQGLVSEALHAVVDYGFDQMKLVRIQALVEPPNRQSQRVLEKNNFLQEGLLRSYEYSCGKMDDLYMYSLLKTDFKS
ncbi:MULTISPECIES: GNAT family protein [Bacillaceae]|uniref:GNAT family N-acetyltransferase n=1 Tax=Bacillaceae TaxID=186817 RepID=UPI001E5BB087|nr:MULTISPECIES: GNAT family protein [Bacillaceae]MCE4048157.1 GNAT family N-acetyltransferase [Bacillus sp. Au-Bac7]MCM3033403.1 GNAT family N-acetyltransferase [Niallia sp. MER 6]MDL0434324.1 GNAT family protein [Niallia sp. SS-2023]UPO89071.1 GNAT family N-acetyltransferase [Niallia sp. Man26]